LDSIVIEQYLGKGGRYLLGNVWLRIANNVRCWLISDYLTDAEVLPLWTAKLTLLGKMSCVDGSQFARVLFCFGVVVRYSLVSGLFARCLFPLALMVSANKVLFRCTDNYVLDIYQVFPIPGL